MKHAILPAMVLLGSALFFELRVSDAEAATVALAPAPPPNPAASKKLSPEMAEYFNMCKPGAGPGLKDSVLNPKCSAYRLNETFGQPAALTPIYESLAPKYCLEGADGAFRCLFRGPKPTCKAYVDAHNQLGQEQGLPWKATPIKNSQGGYQCFYCWSGENTDATAVDGSKYCSANGGFDITFDNPVPQGSYSYFCEENIASGPYSNFPDEYEVCGGTETTAHEGMEFTLSQKARIKQINKLGNDLPEDGNQLKSDLAGFCYPKPPSGCVSPTDEVNATTCREPEFLTEVPYQKNSVNVHHIVPKKDGTSCPCGKNSMKNAALISRSLNTFFSNKDLTQLKSSCGTMKTEVAALHMPYNMLTETIAHLRARPKYDVSLLGKRKKPRGR